MNVIWTGLGKLDITLNVEIEMKKFLNLVQHDSILHKFEE